MVAKIKDRVSPWFYFKVGEGEYGIEIETETKDESNYPDGFLKPKIDPGTGKKWIETPVLKRWSAHYDNSLRNFGVEYVLKEPLNFKDAIAAVKNFGVKTSDIPFIKNAPSTSVHIHWNVFNETFMTMANFLTLYSLYENLLIAYSGPTRRSNLFALPIRVAETIVDNIVDMLSMLNKGSSQKMGFHDGHVKYGSLNLSSLGKLGSLEVRCFRGTTDPEEIETWLSILNSLVTYARLENLNPPEIMSILQNQPEELFQMTFGKYGDLLKDAAGDDFDFLIDKNLWYPKIITEAIPDWSKFNECMDETFAAYDKMTKKSPKKLSQQAADNWDQVTDAWVPQPAIPTITSNVLAGAIGTLSPSEEAILDSVLNDTFWNEDED